MKRKNKKSKKHREMIWFDKRLISKNKKCKSAIEKFIDEIYTELGLINPDINTDKKKMALNIILSNAYEHYQTNKFVAIPFYRDYYTNISSIKFPFITYLFIVGGTKALISKNYLEYKKGYFNKYSPENNEVSGIRATKKLLDTIASYIRKDDDNQNYFETQEGYTFIFSNDEFTKYDFDCVVELKDGTKKKNIIEYRPNRISEQSKKFLREYNAFISSFDILMPASKIKPIKYKLLGINTNITADTKIEYTSSTTIPLIGFCYDKDIIYKKLDCRLKRVFNGCKFNQGGRFYDAEYQKLSEAERSWIIINGNKTVEIDYKSYHPRMLYHELGIEIKGDLYTMVDPREELRKAIKKMLNIMINSCSDYNAMTGFEKYLDSEKGKEVKLAMEKNDVTPKDLIKMIRAKHKRIEKYFSSKEGVKKQYVDSIIAMRIMKYFLRKKIACLCVHDSFIVEEKYERELYALMIIEYKKIFGFEPELEINDKEQKI